jgi:hypothetical protein
MTPRTAAGFQPTAFDISASVVPLAAYIMPMIFSSLLAARAALTTASPLARNALALALLTGLCLGGFAFCGALAGLDRLASHHLLLSNGPSK